MLVFNYDMVKTSKQGQEIGINVWAFLIILVLLGVFIGTMTSYRLNSWIPESISGIITSMKWKTYSDSFNHITIRLPLGWKQPEPNAPGFSYNCETGFSGRCVSLHLFRSGKATKENLRNFNSRAFGFHTEGRWPDVMLREYHTYVGADPAIAYEYLRGNNYCRGSVGGCPLLSRVYLFRHNDELYRLDYEEAEVKQELIASPDDWKYKEVIDIAVKTLRFTN